MSIPAARIAETGDPAIRAYAQQAGSDKMAETLNKSGTACLRRKIQIAHRTRNDWTEKKRTTCIPDIANRWASPVLRRRITMGWEDGGISPVATARR